MPSVQLTRGLPSGRLNTFVDRLLCLLEKVSDEAFWNSLFGDRVLNLLKRYFGSDVVFLGFIVYLARKDESGYDAIQQFVAGKTAQVKSLRVVEGRCVSEDSDDNYDLQGPSPPPKLQLFPLDETEHKIQYKEHTLWVTKKKNGSVNKSSENYYSNNIKDLLGMMNTNPCIEITMLGQDLGLLKSYIQEWIDLHFEKESGKLTIYKCMPSRYEGMDWRTVGSKELRSFNSVILKDGQKEGILKDIQTFRRRQHWYSIRGIPYRRGYLLYGPPGTGKTSLVQSVASKVNMNVAILSLSGSMNDEKFNLLLQEVPRNSILVMEDIDHCVINDPNSENDTSSGKITMSGLLNALDGVIAQEGSMVFMTCNDVSRIQPALLRPGRIDVKLELGYANKVQINKMFWRFMGKDDIEQDVQMERKNTDELDALAQQFTDLIPDLYVTPAELQNFFIVNLIDHEDEGKGQQDFTHLLDHVPAFLETVKRDRDQALEHKSKSATKTPDVHVPKDTSTLVDETSKNI
ncbi:hypothetical protein INT47_012769 [Mucor saturninus]|uniref:AAA+ ATPase domain-containing protein n=1 Tax=Mucor saturninus TaxID=64648 RepID=A0A8H7QR93_9FUNG|nr:hypothetical protein INT47_012769 [Mucor saturninus]